MGIPVFIGQGEVADTIVDASPLTLHFALDGSAAVDTIVDVSPMILVLTLHLTGSAAIVQWEATVPQEPLFPFDPILIYYEVLSYARETPPVCYIPLDRPFGPQVTRALFSPISDSRSLTHVSEWFDVIYNQIWISPPVVDLGVLVEDRDIPVYVWNAYLESDTLLEIDKAQIPSVVYTPLPAPDPYAPTQERQYNLSIPLQGDAEVNGRAIFVWENAPDAYQYVILLRCIPLPILPDAEDVTVEYIYLVVKCTTRTLQEQRRLHDPYMRRVYKVVFHEAKLQRVWPTILRGSGRVVSMPMAHEPIQLEPFTATSKTLYFTEADTFDLKRHNRIFIIDPEQWLWGIREVEEWGDGQVKLVANAGFTSDKAYMFPAILGVLRDASGRWNLAGVPVRTVTLEELLSDD